MTIEHLFWTQLSSIVAFISALFVLYRVLVNQKDATIQLLRERIEDLSERLSEARAQSPDKLAESLSSRISAFERELDRLNSDKRTNAAEIQKKENELSKVKAEADEFKRQLEVASELMEEFLCPFCGAVVERKEHHVDTIEYNGRDADIDHEYILYECGYTLIDGKPDSECRNQRHNKSNARDKRVIAAFEFRDCEMKNIWDKYWNNENNHEWWEQPAPEVIRLIKSQSPEIYPEVLDLGCGLGRHAIAYAKQGYRVTATDASQQAIDHLQKWAGQLDLSIATHVCNMLEQPFHRSFFDIIISYNVIYHGNKNQFAEAIRTVWNLLRSSGLFFFTCPSRRDGKYGFGKMVAPHTYESPKSITPGDIHYFTDRTELDNMLVDFTIENIELDEGYWDNRGDKQFFSNWQVLAKKS